MIMEEFNFYRRDFRLNQVIREHLDFFGSKERKEKLSKLIDNPETIRENDLKLAILAVTVNSKIVYIQEIIKSIILDRSKLDAVEKWIGKEFLFQEIKSRFDLEVEDFQEFLKSLMVVNFYREIQEKPDSELEKYYKGKTNEIYIFVSSLLQNKFQEFLKSLMVVNFYREIQEKPDSELEKYYKGKTNEIYIFVSSLLQNKECSEKIKEIFYELGEELDIKSVIDKLEVEALVLGTAFEYFDKLTIKYIAENLNSEVANYDRYLKYINIRLDNTLYRSKYFDYYKMLITVINLLKIKDELVIRDKSIDGIFEEYINIYYMIDRLYRDFIVSYDVIKGKNSNELFDNLERKISQFYEKDYLEALLSVWTDNFTTESGLPLQKDFYNEYIKNSDTRVAVIISDGLRYEIGEEIAEKLKKEASAKEINLKAMLTGLPSITQVGMANLLPNNERVIDPLRKLYTISGINTINTESREKILKLSCEESSAIIFKDFKNMSRNEQDEFVKGKRVIYIYHDNIDGIGDKSKTEDETFEACDMAIKDIVGISKLLSSLGIVNIYITSDHGFLYERKVVEEYNKIELDKSE